jgi:hypothetical protein
MYSHCNSKSIFLISHKCILSSHFLTYFKTKLHECFLYLLHELNYQKQGIPKGNAHSPTYTQKVPSRFSKYFRNLKMSAVFKLFAGHTGRKWDAVNINRCNTLALNSERVTACFCKVRSVTKYLLHAVLAFTRTLRKYKRIYTLSF